jgi:DNA helicase-2/ATP-dependent DNA helicase PcrA
VAKYHLEQKMQQHHKRCFAILYRTNAQSRAMEDALRKETFLIVFMEAYLLPKEEVKDVLCYLRPVINPKG